MLWSFDKTQAIAHPVLSKSQSMLRNVDTAKMHYARRTLLKPLPKGTAPCL